MEYKIKLDTLMPAAHQARYQMNSNYIAIVKQNISGQIHNTY